MAAVRPLSDATPDAERRGALRHPVEVQGVLSGAGDVPRRVLLTDISEQGCQIVRPTDMDGRASIRLGFGGFAPFHASVIWTSAKAAGLRFDYPAHPALIAQVVAAAKGRKRPRRLLAPDLVRRADRERVWHLNLQVALRAGETRFSGMLSDLSADGCRIVSDARPATGTELLITIAAHRPLSGQVRWTGDGAIGVEFLEPLSSIAVESIAQGDTATRRA